MGTVGRPVTLLGVLAAVSALALALEQGKRPEPVEPRLLDLRVEQVTGIRIEEDGRELRAVRGEEGWQVEMPGDTRPGASTAVADMVRAVTGLIPVDTFARGDIRPGDLGLDPPRVRVTLTLDGGAPSVTLLFGDFVPTGGSVYATIAGDPRVFQIGAMVMSDIERTFYLALEPPS